MTKKNKGYLLTETIIALTVVATVITIVYGVSMNNYIKQNNNVTKNNTTDGLFVAKEVDKYLEPSIENIIDDLGNEDYIKITNQNQDIFDKLDIKTVYFSKYDISKLLETEKLPSLVKQDLKQLKDDEKCPYRYIIIFKDNSYSTIGAFCAE